MSLLKTKKDREEARKAILMLAGFVIAIMLALIVYDSLQTVPELGWAGDLMFPVDLVHFVVVVGVLSLAILVIGIFSKGD